MRAAVIRRWPRHNPRASPPLILAAPPTTAADAQPAHSLILPLSALRAGGEEVGVAGVEDAEADAVAVGQDL